jgi:hypothetical protein
LSYNHLRGSIPVELMNLVNLVAGGSDSCWNQLYTTNDDLRSFLNSKQDGGDWEACQTAFNEEQCSSFLIAESFWYGIEGIPDGSQTVTIQATLQNADSSGADISFSTETSQMWGYPIDPDESVFDIPQSSINIIEEPSGTIPYDATFSYHLEVNLSGLPAIDKLGFRVVTVEGGTISPSEVPLTESCVIFIIKQKAMPWILLLLLGD